MKTLQINILRWQALTLIVGLAIHACEVQADETEQLIDKNLFSYCATMSLVVENLHEDIPTQYGLTKEAIQNSVESRLRAARLFTSNVYSDQYLYVNVNIVYISGRSSIPFNIGIDLNRYIDDTGFGKSGVVEVWSSGFTGQGRSTFIMSNLSRMMDKFITQYMRANEKECS